MRWIIICSGSTVPFPAIATAQFPGSHQSYKQRRWKMTKPTLETLPTLVTDSICEYLALHNTPRSSLLAFSLVSRACHTMAHRQRCKRVLLRSCNANRLLKDIEWWESLLEGGSKRYVRQVKVLVDMSAVGEKTEELLTMDEFISPSFREMKEEIDYEMERSATEDLFLEPEYCKTRNSRDLHRTLHYLEKSNPTKILQDSNAWSVLAKFLSTLPGLKILVWNCLYQVPASILDVLATRNIQLRNYSHILLNFRNHRPNVTEKLEFDLHEFRVASYSNLTHFATVFQARNRRSSYYGIEHLMLKMASSLKSLKSLRIAGYSFIKSGHICDPRCHVLEFSDGWKVPTSRGHLEILELEIPTCGTCLEKWNQYVALEEINDFSVALVGDGLRVMTDMASRGTFKALRSLSLSYGRHPDGRRLYGRFSNFIYQKLDKLISTVKGITSLELRFRYIPLEEMNIGHLGSSLKKLHAKGLTPTSQQIEQLTHNFPNLQNLELSIYRWGDSKGETSIYLALGKFSRLQHLYIHLKCGRGCDLPIVTKSDENHPERFDKILKSLQTVITIYTIDDTLVTQIWDLIRTSQSNVTNHGKPALNTFRVSSQTRSGIFKEPWPAPSIWDKKKNADWGAKEANVAICTMAGSYMYIADPRDTHSNQILRKRLTLARNDELVHEYQWKLNNSLAGKWLRMAWNQLWPEVTGEYWFEQYHGLPLN